MGYGGVFCNNGLHVIPLSLHNLKAPPVHPTSAGRLPSWAMRPTTRPWTSSSLMWPPCCHTGAAWDNTQIVFYPTLDAILASSDLTGLEGADSLTANVCITTTPPYGNVRPSWWPLTDLWWCPRYGPDLTCSPLSCGSPQSSAHAQVTAQCTSFRCQARVSCMPGYTVREGGAATRICQADGTWTQVTLYTHCTAYWHQTMVWYFRPTWTASRSAVTFLKILLTEKHYFHPQISERLSIMRNTFNNALPGPRLPFSPQIPS